MTAKLSKHGMIRDLWRFFIALAPVVLAAGLSKLVFSSSNHWMLDYLRALNVGGKVEERADNLFKFVSESLQGEYAFLALSAISLNVLFPLAINKPDYSWSVWYGLTVAAIGYALYSFLQPSDIKELALIGATIFYGLRLGIYLYLRKLVGGWTAHKEIQFNLRMRVVLALVLSFLYAFMTAPILYVLRQPAVSEREARVAWTGTIIAWVGAIVETIADTHKTFNKQGKDPKVFQGPINGLYRVTRHPNYTGEIVFWLGIYIAGIPSFQQSITAWSTSTAGLLIIVWIMMQSYPKLEFRQAEKYGRQEKFYTWKKTVRAPLIPFVYDKGE